MAQILNTPTAAQMSAQQFTDPIMQSLQNLTSMQLNSINQQKQRANTMAGLSALMPKEQANMMSYLPQELLKVLMPQMQKQQQMQQGLELYDKMRNQNNPQEQPVMQGNQVSPQSQQAVQGNQLNPEDMIQSMIGAGNNGPQSNQEIMQNAFNSMPQNGQQPQAMQPQQQKSEEDLAAEDAFRKAYILSSGNIPAALKAEENVRRKFQKDKIAKEKVDAKRSAVLEERITKSQDKGWDEAKESQTKIDAANKSLSNYKNILKLLKTGKGVTGLPAKFLKDFGIDKSVTGWETQLMDKLFSAEPINAMAFVPPGAARLSKVFETLRDMHGSIINSPAGIEAIARSKIVESKISKLIEKRYQERLEKRRKAGKAIPFDLKERAAKDPDIVKKLNKYEVETEFIISDALERGDAKIGEPKTGAILSDFKYGEKIGDDGGSGRMFIKKKLFGKPAWVLFEGK